MSSAPPRDQRRSVPSRVLLRAAGLGRLSRSLGSEAGWARVMAALAQHRELRTYGEQHRALWRCAQEQITALDASLAGFFRCGGRPPADDTRCRTHRSLHGDRRLLHPRALCRCQARGELTPDWCPPPTSPARDSAQHRSVVVGTQSGGGLGDRRHRRDAGNARLLWRAWNRRGHRGDQDPHINRAYERMLNSDVKYRFVIDMASLKA
jgi:hypothetical protein